MNIDLLLERIKELSENKGISLTAAFIESGVGKNFKSNLKIANPSIGKITMLANYFDVSVDYLLGKTDIKKEKPAALSDRAWESISNDKNKTLLANWIMSLEGDELDRAIQLINAAFPGMKVTDQDKE